MFRPLATITVVLTVVLLAAAAPQAAAQGATGSTGSATNSCTNPRLAQNVAGWSMLGGGQGQRSAVSGHVAARHGFRATAATSPVSIRLPQQTVRPGQQYTFAFDAQVGANSYVRTLVYWFDPAGARLGRTDGPPVVAGPTRWTRIPVTAAAPAGANRAVAVGYATLARGTVWTSTACDYSTSGGVTNPSTDATQAATRLGWGPRVEGDEFDGGTEIDPRKWSLYEGAGHAGNGRRDPSQIAQANGVLTISGDSAGRTGGMSMNQGRRQYGRWEARMRVPAGDRRYHPVLLLWPDAENWPVGGEIDYAETTAAASRIEFFLHFSAQNRQTSAAAAVDLTQWHNYAVEWTPTGIRGYLDGVEYFRDDERSHLPPGSMHQTIQLDWFPGDGSGPVTPSSMQVDWVRIYNL